jgi:DNA invertase Pin-like site-specific DNA recombinase
MENKIAAIYARVSTSNGTQDYQRQIDELVHIAKNDGFTTDNIQIYAESISGYKIDDRIKLNELMDEIDDNPNKFGCLYTSEISRIGRDPRLTRKIIDHLTVLRIPVYIQSLNRRTIDLDGKSDFVMNIILQVLMEYAHLEAETFKTRSKSGIRNGVKKGHAGGGKYLPYGYKKDENKILIIDEEESETISRIFELYKKGNGTKVISNILNTDKIPTRTHKSFGEQEINFNFPKKGRDIKWSDSQVYSIITNPIYKGERRFKGEFFNAPAIISSDLFHECNDLLKNKIVWNRKTSYTFLLKDIIICGKCGRNYFGRYKPTKGGDKVYKCSSTLINKGSCGNSGVNIKYIESILYERICDVKLVEKYLDIPTLEEDIKSSIEKIQYKIENDELAYTNKSQETEKLLNLYLENFISFDTFKKKGDEINKSIVLIRDRLVNLKNELKAKKGTLESIANDSIKNNIIKSSKNDRIKLQAFFKQIYHKVIINSLGNDFVLCTLNLKVGNEILFPSLKILLDLSQVKKKHKMLRYKCNHLLQEPYFVNNILLDDIKDIKNQFDIESIYISTNSDGVVDIIDNNRWLTIQDDNIIEIAPMNEDLAQ